MSKVTFVVLHQPLGLRCLNVLKGSHTVQEEDLRGVNAPCPLNQIWTEPPQSFLVNPIRFIAPPNQIHSPTQSDS